MIRHRADFLNLNFAWIRTKCRTGYRDDMATPESLPGIVESVRAFTYGTLPEPIGERTYNINEIIKHSSLACGFVHDYTTKSVYANIVRTTFEGVTADWASANLIAFHRGNIALMYPGLQAAVNKYLHFLFMRTLNPRVTTWLKRSFVGFPISRPCIGL